MPVPSLNLIVLKTVQVGRLRDFYTQLGFQFIEEQHGKGPKHYSANSLGRIELAVTTICNLIQSETPTLVSCSAGMSRSPAFVAAALSRLSGISIDDALVRISETGPCDVAPVLLAEISQHVEKINGDDQS